MATAREYQICTRCIMDTTDPEITFDEDGVCNHCHKYDERVAKGGYKEGQSEEQLREIVGTLKKDGRNSAYDCILGISGGVDSSYLMHLTYKLGLRTLAVHVDAGWNSEVAVDNIGKLCRKTGFDLHTIVIDWPTMKRLQRAFMFSGLPNLDVPQDHVLFAGLYQYAKKDKVKHVVTGHNLATEGILPHAWGYSASDWRHVKGVYKKCSSGSNPPCGSKAAVGGLRKYPHFSFTDFISMQMKNTQIPLLNYVPYSKKEAIKTLSEEYGWQYYGGKHFESRFTKFFQSYYLPRKFGYDKRRAHLASLVVGGEMTREEALKEMADESAYPESEMLEDLDYILKKLDISEAEWEQIMEMPNRTEDDYPSYKNIVILLKKIYLHLAM